MSCGFFMLATTQNLLMFYVSMFILSIGKGACASVVTMTAVANWFHQKIGLALGIPDFGGSELSGLAVPVIVWLIDSYGWRAASCYPWCQHAGYWHSSGDDCQEQAGGDRLISGRCLLQRKMSF